MTIEFRPGGVIRTPFTKTEGMPIQPAAAVGVRGTAEVFAEYRSGLNDAGHQPYVLEFDAAVDVRIGWVQNAIPSLSRQESDDRVT